MTDQRNLTDHYTHGGLGDAIRAGIAALGKTPETMTLADFAPIDEFHVGGRQASEALLDQLQLVSGMQVLDIGCGIGGAARFAADRYGVQVSGVDLTVEYAAVGQEICGWLGFGGQIELQQGNALELPFADGSFDAAYMMHVGMNIPDKAALCREAARVLKPGGAFAIYDIMRTGTGDLTFPVPWASVVATSAVAPPEEYRDALEGAGLGITSERNRRDFALAFFERLRTGLAKIQRETGGPPPLGLHILMGANAPEKYGNMVANITAGLIAPVEMIARKSA